MAFLKIYLKPIFNIAFFKHKLSGSSIVEASIVLPVCILVIVSMITLGINLTEEIREYSNENEKYAENILSPAVSAESLLRIKWIGTKLTED